MTLNLLTRAGCKIFLQSGVQHSLIGHSKECSQVKKRMYSLSCLYQAKVVLVSPFNSKISTAEIFSKNCYFLPLNTQSTTTNKGMHFWITCEVSYLLLYCCYIIIVILQHIVFRTLSLQPRHKTSSIIAK